MSAPNYARKVYLSVVEDVLTNVRESFLDEGVDEQVLQELKQLWESKLTASRALDPPEPEQAAPSSIPYTIIQQQQTSQNNVVSAAGTNVQQIPMPVQINTESAQIGNASMAFSAPGGMIPQQLQALVNVNPGAQLTLQQTANGQYILQAMTPGTQGQMVNIPQQAIIQSQPGQVQQIQAQTLPQFDGTNDEKTTDIPDIEHECTQEDEQNDKTNDLLHEEPNCLGACGQSNDCIDIEFEASNALSKKLLSDLKRSGRVPQLDGNHDTSSSEDDYDDDDDGNDDDEEKEDGDEEVEEEEPLNTDDDVSEEDPTELFDTDNVIVCQFEKITRHKSRWKISLKDGIMNLDGKDHVFQKGIGEADW
ncbi:Transcription initiation factor IIA subunit 1 [Mactra antiquata]